MIPIWHSVIREAANIVDLSPEAPKLAAQINWIKSVQMLYFLINEIVRLGIDQPS